MDKILNRIFIHSRKIESKNWNIYSLKNGTKLLLARYHLDIKRTKKEKKTKKVIRQYIKRLLNLKRTTKCQTSIENLAKNDGTWLTEVADGLKTNVRSI